MSQLRVAQWGVLLLLGVVAKSLAAEPVYYVFEMDGKPIGFVEVTADEMTLNGQSSSGCVPRRRSSSRWAARRTRSFDVPRHSCNLTPACRCTTNSRRMRTGASRTWRPSSRVSRCGTWQWAEGAPKGDPKDVAVTAETRILGTNDFSHWGLLLKAAAAQPVDRAAELTVFLPEVAAVQSLRLKRGEPQNLDVAGTAHACQAWQLEGAGIEILTDAQSRASFCV